MKKHTLKGNKRDLTGRKVKKLRNAGNIPATIYGKNVKSESIQVAASDFKKTYADAGETGLVELTIDSVAHPVLIHNVQRDPVHNDLLHVEFYQVDLKEKVKTNVPVVLTGASPAVGERRGVLLSLLSEIEVEALPTDLPEKIEIDVSKLTDVDQEIKVSDITVPAGVTVLSEQAVGVVKVGALVSKEAEAQAAAEAAAAAEAQATAETAAPTTGAEQVPQEAEGSEAKPAEKTEEPAKA